MRMQTVVALLTCHNRRDLTERCLASLFGQRHRGLRVDAVLVDDGSTDGTSEAVRRGYPQVRVVEGTGDLYWAGGMALAQLHALDHHRPDFLLWLNDDVVLEPTAVQALVDVARQHGGCVAVGAVRDPGTGTTSYSGLRRCGRRPRGFVVVEPTALAQPVDTFNGNVVLVPRAVYEAVGGVDARMRHGYADLDYGLRARRAGFPSVLAPGHVGCCGGNPVDGTWRDPLVPRRQRLRLLFGPKGIPLGPHVRYCRRHGGRDWPVFVVGCYTKALGRVLLGLRA
jgi:GT2 family glycosyltransferase